MKKMNKKGFTLIELLAVIVILGVLLAIAVPAVTKYITSSKKSSYIANCKDYMDSARSEILDPDGEYDEPVSTKDATVIYFSSLQPKLEKGGKTSSYGAEYDPESSFVVIVNEGTPERPNLKYYVAARDKSGYGIGLVSDTSTDAKIIQYDELKSTNVVQLATGATCNATVTDGSTTVATLSTPPGTLDSVNVTRVYK